MRYVELTHGVLSSRIGFGCGRLFGGVSHAASAKLIERALTLGISHFDVAPSYGFGLAERELGRALTGVQNVAIITKAGIRRPKWGGAKSVGRMIARRLLRDAPQLTHTALRTLSTLDADRGRFAPAELEDSFQRSLEELRRDSVDGLLLHEPSDSLVGAALPLDQWQDAGLVRTWGVGTGADSAKLPNLGPIRQFCWTPENALHRAPEGQIYIRHGLFRYGLPLLKKVLARQPDIQLLGRLGLRGADDPGITASLITVALALDPNGIVLVSSNDAERLREVLTRIDWTQTDGRDDAFVEAGTEVCALMQRLAM